MDRGPRETAVEDLPGTVREAAQDASALGVVTYFTDSGRRVAAVVPVEVADAFLLERDLPTATAEQRAAAAAQWRAAVGEPDPAALEWARRALSGQPPASGDDRP